MAALAGADFGIAVYADYASATSASVDALLVTESAPNTSQELARFPFIFDLASKTFVKIKQNLLWAVVYNTLALCLSTGAFERFSIALNPIYAGFGMSLSSIFVLMNSMVLERAFTRRPD